MGDIMATAKIDFKQFTQFAKQFESLKDAEFDTLCRQIVYRLAYELLKKVKNRTPVNQKIPNDVNYNGGGDLRDGWEIGEITKEDGMYRAEVINPVYYALFVEKGHRGVYVPELGVTLHLDTHWTDGVFMLQISEGEIKKVADKFVQAKLDIFIKSHFK